MKHLGRQSDDNDVVVRAQLADVGGQNLLYNTAFRKATNGLADGWGADGTGTGGTGTYSMVASPVGGPEFAQRIDFTGINTSSIYRGLSVPSGRKVPAMEGQSLAAAVYFRATAGITLRIFLRALNAAGSSVGQVIVNVVATGQIQRITALYPSLPANTTQADIFLRALGASAGTSGYIELFRPKLSLSSTIDAWSEDQNTAREDIATKATLAETLAQLQGFGWGVTGDAPLLDNVDSTTTATGAYRVNVPSSGTLPSGAGTYGTMRVERYSASYIKQTYTPTANVALPNSVWVRTYNGLTGVLAWTPWVQLANAQALIDEGTANLLPAEYCVFSSTLPTIYRNAGLTLESVADTATARGYALRVTTSTATSTTFVLAPTVTSGASPDNNMSMKRQKYLVSFRAKANVAGHVIAVYARTLRADNSTISSTSTATATLTTDWARYALVLDMTAATFDGSQWQLAVQVNRSTTSGRIIDFDSIMVEPVSGETVDPSTFVVGPSFDQVTRLTQVGWTTMTLVSGFTAGASPPQYRLVNDMVEMRGKIVIAAALAAGALRQFLAAPAGYRPTWLASTTDPLRIPVCNVTTGAGGCYLNALSTGVFSVGAASGYAAGDIIDLSNIRFAAL